MTDKHFFDSGTPYELHDLDGKKYRLFMWESTRAEDPREWRNLSRMFCFARSYNLGDKHDYDDLQDCLEQLADKYGVEFKHERNDIKQRDMSVIAALAPYCCIKYLYLLDHSGITISTHDFHDPWDSGIIGIAVIPKETMLKECKVGEDDWYQQACATIDAEVKIYDDFIRGDVWGFTLKKLVHRYEETRCPHCGEIVSSRDYDEWEEVDQCGGFYGSTLEESGLLSEIYPQGLLFNEE